MSHDDLLREHFGGSDDPLRADHLTSPWTLRDRITLIDLGDIRVVVGPDLALTLHATDADAIPQAFPRGSVQLDSCGRLRVGRPWTFAFVDADRAVVRTTPAVRHIRQYRGTLAEGARRERPEGGVAVRQTSVREVWSLDGCGTHVTVRIRTCGAWNGVWSLSAQGIPAVFVSDDPGGASREWDRLWLPGHARVDATLRLSHEVARGVWVPIDVEGCGTVTDILVEEVA